MRTNKWVRTLGLVLLSAVVLAACGGAGAGDSSGSAPDFTDITMLPPLSGPAITSLSGSDSAAGTIGLIGYNGAIGAQAWLLIAVAGWSEDAPPSYSSGGYTIAWTRSGNTWCWDIYDGGSPGSGEVWYSVCVTDTGSGWSLEVRDELEEVTLVTGTLSYNATSGNVTYYSPDARFEVVWGPGSGWEYTVTATYYEDDVSQGYLTLSFNESGGEASEGDWSVYDAGGTPLDSGSWSPL